MRARTNRRAVPRRFIHAGRRFFDTRGGWPNGVAVEGSSEGLAAVTPGAWPMFNPAAGGRRYFIDVFNTGTSAMTWTAQAGPPWITLSQNTGSADARVLVGVDWTKAPRGNPVKGTLTIRGADTTRTVHMAAFYPPALDLARLPVAVENNGAVSIEAEDFEQVRPSNRRGTLAKTARPTLPAKVALPAADQRARRTFADGQIGPPS